MKGANYPANAMNSGISITVVHRLKERRISATPDTTLSA